MSTSTQWQLARGAAERYQQIIVPSFIGPFAVALVEWAAPKAGDAVLDVGCGTGAATLCAAERVGPEGRVVGIDVNAGMIDVARSLSVARGAPIDWHEQSAYQLPLSDATVDVVLCTQVLQFLADKKKALAEMHRVLKAGGRVALSMWSDPSESPYFFALADAVAQHLRPDPASGLGTGSGARLADEIDGLLSESGFESIEMTIQQIDLELPAMNEFVPRYLSATPLAAAFGGAPQPVQEAIATQVAERLERYAAGRGLRVPFRSHMVRAKK